MEGRPPPWEAPWPGPEAPPATSGWQQPPAVFGGVQLASWGSRAGAAALDTLLVVGIWIALIAPGVVITAATTADAVGVTLLVVGAVAALVVGFLYAPFFMQRSGVHNGQTLGKQWVGIRVVRVSGEPFGWGWALLREFVLKGIALGVAVEHRQRTHVLPARRGRHRALSRRLPLAALGRPEPRRARHDRRDPGDPGLAQAAAGLRRSVALAQIISSRAGPTPTITTGMPRKSEMNSR